MNRQVIGAIARQFFRRKFLNLGALSLLLVYVCTQGYVALERWQSYTHQQELRQAHQEADRQSWESNPDKHPHRMAHFGAFAFRHQHPLSIFDAGLESYMGNVVFLEAHKQNTANFSEASLSTGLIRFGDLHPAMLLYLILPLFIFFIGYDAITREREGRTLRLMYVQGASMREVIVGKSLGLFAGSALFFVPALAMLWAIALVDVPDWHGETLLRIGLLTLAYTLFFVVLSLLTVIVSAWSRSSSQSLLALLGLWLVFFVVVPKTAQAVGVALHPSPSKLAFKQAIEAEVTAGGDPHNPNDPHFHAIRDSILRVYGVEDVKELPFNYGGYLMGLGEERTATIYARHQAQLTDIYREQNTLVRTLATVNPYLAIKGLSSSLAGTDFETYNSFLLQSEDYRYHLAQYMNKLQMEHIASHALGSTEGRINVVGRDHFKAMPEFRYQYMPVEQVLAGQALAIVSLVAVCLVLLFIALGRAHTFRIL